MLEHYTTKELIKEVERRKEKEFISDRFCILGYWGAADKDTDLVCYRKYTTDKVFAERVSKLNRIHFSDGTSMKLVVRPMRYREKKEPEHLSYSGLINKCLEQETNAVSELDK